MRSTVHEMRNQLAVAMANIEAFMDGKLTPTHERLAAVLGALDTLNSLMAELPPALAVAPAVAAMRPVDVCALIARETTAMEASAAAAGVALDLDICTQSHLECPRFFCDAVQVSQVVKNVVLNALKYTGRGGRVKLVCRREPGLFALEVGDSGPGVGAAERLAIFERGVRGSRSRGVAGNGDGLAVVRRILQAHHGTVTVTESPAGGALFVVRLPGDTSSSDRCLTRARRAAPLHERAR